MGLVTRGDKITVEKGTTSNVEQKNIMVTFGFTE